MREFICNNMAFSFLVVGAVAHFAGVVLGSYFARRQCDVWEDITPVEPKTTEQIYRDVMGDDIPDLLKRQAD